MTVTRRAPATRAWGCEVGDEQRADAPPHPVGLDE